MIHCPQIATSNTEGNTEKSTMSKLFGNQWFTCISGSTIEEVQCQAVEGEKKKERKKERH